MKLIRFTILMMLLSFVYVPLAFSLGVAHSVIADNTIHMDVGSTYSMDFILQNADDVTKVMVFSVESQFPLVMGDKDDHSSVFTEEYRLSPNTNKKITVKFYAPQFKGKFPVTYGYYEKNSGSGQIQIIQETSGKFYISVGSSTTLFSGIGIPYDYADYRLVTYKSGLYDHDDLLFIEKHDLARIQFNDDVDLVGFKEKYVHMAFNNVSVDSSAFAQFRDKDARITFYNLSYAKEPIILRNGIACGSSCDIISYDEDDGKLVFSVEGFSSYSTKASPLESAASSSSGGSFSGGSTSSSSVPDVVLPGAKKTDDAVSDDDDGVSMTTKKAVAEDSSSDSAKAGVGALAKATGNLLDNSQEVSKSGGFSVDPLAAGARKIFGAIAWGFGTLFLSVALLLTFVKDNYSVLEEILK